MDGRGRAVAIAGLLGSVACVAVLHVVRSDLSPVSHRLSEYANGPHGWIMTTSFVALGCGLLALGMGLGRSARGAMGWTVPAAAFTAAAGAILSGIFRTGISDAVEVIHSRASGIAVVAVVILALAYSLSSFRHRPAEIPDTFGAGLALTAAALAAVSPVFHETRWTGLSQRLLWIALISWLLWTASRPAPVREESRGLDQAPVS